MTSTTRVRPSSVELPRRGRVKVYAQTGEVSAAAILAKFTSFADEMRASAAKTKAELELNEKEFARLNAKLAGLTINGVRGQAPGLDPSKPISQVLNNFMRTGGDGMLNNFVQAQAGINASMSVGSDPDGGYTVIDEMDTTIATLARDISPMRQIATVRTLRTGGALKRVVETDLPLSGWGGEQQGRTQTAASKLALLEWPVNELWAMPAATQTLLDNSSEDIGQWLAGRCAISFSLQEGTAFISGDGVVKPRGILTYPTEPGDDFTRSKWSTVQYVPAGSTTPTNAQLASAIVTLSTTLREPYQTSNTCWLMNRSTKNALRGLTYSSTDNRLLWSIDGRYVDPANDQLLGYPVMIDPNMPSMAANSYPVAFGDFKQGYVVVDRIGLRVLRDPFSAKPLVLFYCTKRVGGGLSGDGFNSIKLLKISSS